MQLFPGPVPSPDLLYKQRCLLHDLLEVRNLFKIGILFTYLFLFLFFYLLSTFLFLLPLLKFVCFFIFLLFVLHVLVVGHFIFVLLDLFLNRAHVFGFFIEIVFCFCFSGQFFRFFHGFFWGKGVLKFLS